MYPLIPFLRLLKRHPNLNLLLHLVVEMVVRMEDEEEVEDVEEVDTEDQENLVAEQEEKESLEEEEEDEVDSEDEEEVKADEEEDEGPPPLRRAKPKIAAIGPRKPKQPNRHTVQRQSDSNHVHSSSFSQFTRLHSI